MKFVSVNFSITSLGLIISSSTNLGVLGVRGVIVPVPMPLLGVLISILLFEREALTGAGILVGVVAVAIFSVRLCMGRNG